MTVVRWLNYGKRQVPGRLGFRSQILNASRPALTSPLASASAAPKTIWRAKVGHPPDAGGGGLRRV
jgi:hypothetical protein